MHGTKGGDVNLGCNHKRILHDDVIKWKHFPRYCPFVMGIHRSPVHPPHKGQWRGALMVSLNSAWTIGGINNWYADDLKRHRAHHDVNAMEPVSAISLQMTVHWFGGVSSSMDLNRWPHSKVPAVCVIYLSSIPQTALEQEISLRVHIRYANRHEQQMPR